MPNILNGWSTLLYILGVQHDELVQYAQDAFAAAKSGSAASKAKSTYGVCT